MNILMVTERYFPIWGGAESQLQQLIPYLVSRGCTVEIVTRRWHLGMDRQEDIDGVSVSRLGIPGSSNWATLIFILSLLVFFIRNRTNVDIYHSHGAVNMGVFCRVAKILTGKKNVTKIATAGRISKLSTKLYGRFLLALFKRSDAIICMTEEIQKELSDINTPAAAIRRITNGVNGNRFVPVSSKQRILWRQHWGIKDSDKLILFSSRLVPRKGLDILLNGWPVIQENYPNIWLLIIGSGTDQSDSTEKQMREKVNREKLINVQFLGETNKLEQYLGVADLFVFPSKQEGFPNALLEAMAAGLPVVASRIGGVIDIIEENKTGILFESGNSNDLALQISSCLARPETLKKMGKQARDYVLTQYSFEAIATQYVAVYRDLLKEN